MSVSASFLCCVNIRSLANSPMTLILRSLRFPRFLSPEFHLRICCARFTSYDFKKQQRRSYYPSNQQVDTQIATVATGTSSTGAVSRPVTPGTEIGQMDSLSGDAYGGMRKASHEPATDRRETIPLDVNNEKAYVM